MADLQQRPFKAHMVLKDTKEVDVTPEATLTAARLEKVRAVKYAAVVYDMNPEAKTDVAAVVDGGFKKTAPHWWDAEQAAPGVFKGTQT